MICSRQNVHLKDMRRARRCKDEDALIEGPHLLAEALAAGLEPRSVLATPDFLASPTGVDLAARLPRPLLEVEPRLLDEVADADSPRGIAALVHLPRAGVSALPLAADGVYVYVEGAQDPGNLGALARVAEASGAAGLVLAPGSVHPNHPRALRASAGSLLRLPLARGVSPDELDRHLAALVPRWLALVAHGGVDLYDATAHGSLVVALGAEGPGLSEELRRRADLELTIPLEAGVESLNVTVAAAVTLFELRRRRVRATPART